MRMPRCLTLCAVAIAAVVGSVRCGGVTSSTPPSPADASVDAPGHDASAPADAGDTGADASTTCLDCDAGDEAVALTVCPASPPTVDASCAPTPSGEQCEYGPSWWLACNDVLRCTSGTWHGGAGLGPGPCGQLDAGTCPATWAEASDVDAATGCPAVDCQYPEGACECLSGCGGGGQLRELVSGSWMCQAATTECPSPRPHLGTPCSDATASCQYGWPCGCGQHLECKDGVWQGDSLPPCP
jgi:hypothetical protein